MTRLAISVICIFLFACAHRQEPPLVAQALSEPSSTKVPPPVLLEKPTDVWKVNGCGKRDLPFLKIVSQNITPSSPQRGQYFEHHFVYVACLSDAQSHIKGTISRKITYNKKSVFESTNDGFEIKSGKWEHIAKIKTPPKIALGNYKFILSISTLNTTKTPSPKELHFKIRK